MPIEIERKFLLKSEKWRDLITKSTQFKQGYFFSDSKASVRVRIEGEHANINIKGATLGVVRKEYEYPIPLNEAEELLEHLCQQPLIEKIRHLVPYHGQLFEIDEFQGENQNLIVAEVELADENQSIDLPDWIGEDVSYDKKYYSSLLAKHPYSQWS